MIGKSKESVLSGGLTKSDHDPSSALKLWRAVVSLAIADSASGKKYYTNPVRTWLLSNDFYTVCGMAQIHHETINKIIKELLSMEPTVAQAYSKKAIEELNNI